MIAQLHPSCPTRPVRTSQAEPPRAGQALEFYRSELGRDAAVERVERMIVGLTGIGREPVVTISHWSEGRRAGQILIFRSCVEIVREAIAAARTPDRCGRLIIGEFPSRPGGVRIRCSSRTSARPKPGVVFFDRLRPNGSPIGRPTSLRVGPELDALTTALDWISSVTPT